jgi:hypothetical protein
MDEVRISPFGGIAGRVLRDSMSVGALVTGGAIGVILLAEWYVLGYAGSMAAAHIVAQLVIAVALARFALNGMAGEYRGTVFSGAGGSWGTVLAVAGRYMVLNLMWAAPLVLIAWGAAVSAMAGPAAAGAAGMPGAGDAGALDPAGGAGAPGFAPSPGGLPVMLPVLGLLTSRPFLFSSGLVLLCLTLLPPALLIVAVRSDRFVDIVSPAHWRATFSGRMDDLYALYSLYGGGLGTMFTLAVTAVLVGFTMASEIGWALAVVMLTFMGGLMVTLLGRLCGFFAFGDQDGVAGWAPVPASGATRGDLAQETPDGVAVPPAAQAQSAGLAHVIVHPAALRAGVTAEGAEGAEGADGATPASPGIDPPAAETPVLPPLPDAAGLAAAARTKFATDRDGAIRDLEALRPGHAPSPPVLHALCLCLQEAGRVPEAVAVAREAVPLALARGEVAIAADTFVAVWKHARELGLDRAQIDIVGSALAKAGDLGHAVSAYGLALTMDPTDRKAIKGLLQIADRRLHEERRPADAARIYTFLLQYASGGPFAEDMKRGRAEAEARIARAS